MENDERRGVVPSLFAALSRIFREVTIARKLWLGFGLLLLILAFAGLVSCWQIRQIEKDVKHPLAVAEPLEEAILEMEIKARHTAMEVLHYTRDCAPEHIENACDSCACFERCAVNLVELAETEEEIKLGRDVAKTHAEFKKCGDEIVTLAGRRNAALLLLTEDAKKIGELIDEAIQRDVERTAFDAKKKLEAALEMEVKIGEAFAAVQAYIVLRDPILLQEILNAERDFKRFEAMYRETSLSADEKRRLSEIDKDFEEAVDAGNQIIAITDELHDLFEQFEGDLEKIETYLDGEIQPLMHGETFRVAEAASTSISTAAMLLLVLGIIGIGIGSTSARALSKGITGPIHELVKGTEIVGLGTLEHKIDIKTKDEFGQLADAFNRMIEKLRRSEGLLRESETRLRTVLDEAPCSLIIFNGNEILYLFNKAAERMFGYTSKEVIGKRFNTLMAEPYRSEHDGYITHDEEKIIGISHEVAGQRKDGAVFPMELALSEMRLGERLIFTAIGRDITERKESEEKLKEANRELDAFSYTVSHDLRTILTPIIGFAELLRKEYRECLDEKALDMLAEIEKQGDRMAALLEDLLDLARAGYVERPAESVDAGEVVQRVIEELDGQIASAGVAVQKDPLPAVYVPKTLLAAIFGNLIGNAVRYAGGRGSSIEVGGERSGERVRFYVRDHGPGIPAEERSRIFEVFFRGSTGEKIPGTGVGLAIVRKISRLYKGRAWVEETPGGGSTFWVEMVDSRLS